MEQRAAVPKRKWKENKAKIKEELKPGLSPTVDSNSARIHASKYHLKTLREQDEGDHVGILYSTDIKGNADLKVSPMRAVQRLIEHNEDSKAIISSI